jgi:hypothetical protein
LQEGGYTLAVEFRAAWVLRAKDPVLTIEIATADRILASEVLSADANDLVRIAFTVPSEVDVETCKIEFRLSHHANASLEIRELRLGATHPEAPRKKRLNSPSVFWRSSTLRLLHRPA